MLRVPGGRGDFIVTADGRRLWDKRGDGSGFPAPEEILRRLEAP